jgi:hypothetical protein
MGGQSLGEGASLEEISEQILYYHRDRRIGIALAEDNEGNVSLGMESLMEEAVQFLGLCIAFYSLPSSLELFQTTKNEGDDHSDYPATTTEMGDNDKTQAIFLNNSTLVFIPLESSPNILAVVQVSRLYQNGIKSDTGSGNPLAIRASIERTHALFCMLRGGGVLNRLTATLSKSATSNALSTGCPYQGMEKLFLLLKELRKSRAKLSRMDTSLEEACYEETRRRIEGVQEEIRLLRQKLPIQSIRRDLDAHYKEYLSEFSLVVSRNGGAGRCLVEMMPVPIAQDNGSHTFQVPPSFVAPNTVGSLKQSIHQIIKSHSKSSTEENKNSILVGISTFHSGQIMHSSTKFDDKLSLSNDSASLLMAYMASYRTKLNHLATTRDSLVETNATDNSSSNPSFNVFRRSLADEPPRNLLDNVIDDELNWSQNSLHHRGRFLSRPPSFMLSASHQTYSLGTDGQDIWAPLVHLPMARSQGNDTNAGTTFRTHMVLFDFFDFSFLLFLDLPLTKDHCPGELFNSRLLLMKLEEEISEAVLLALNDGNNDIQENESFTTTMEWTNGPGQDIILLEASNRKLILFQDPIHPALRRGAKKKTSNKLEKSPPRRFLGFGPKKKGNVISQSSKQGATALEWSALGLDCRHLLASRLPLDVCLGFDDMINEVSRRKQNYVNGDTSSPPGETTTLELCTYMACGWIYAFGKGDKEIYAFFDNAIYVTVADVQAAALRIQETFGVT